MILTADQIRDLANFAGFECLSKGNDIDLDCQYQIHECNGKAVADENGNIEGYYMHTATIYEYPEEGCMPLGKQIEETK